MNKLFFLILSTLVLQAQSINGFLEDDRKNTPLAAAKICDIHHCVESDRYGSFEIDTNSSKLYVLAAGYKKFTFLANDLKKIHFLVPFHVKALYLTFWGANRHSKTFKKTLELLKSGGLNAVVVDIKNEYGDVLYKSLLKKPLKYGAFKNRQVYDIDDFVSKLKKENAYLIARIVLFKDELQAAANPDYAIRKNGHIWRNYDGIAWVDPFDRRSWKYAVDIAEDAAKKGFDEINFDYIRFPANQDIELQKPNTMQNRYEALDGFLAYAKKRLRPYGVFISVDIFGNICWSRDDMKIGQNIRNFAKYADYIAPMLYPSSFESGTLGYRYPSEYPYEMVYKSILHASSKIDPKRIRPWIQAFHDYTVRKKRYRDYEVQQQILGAKNAGADGWMLWSPSSKYKITYFQPGSADTNVMTASSISSKPNQID